MPVFWNEMKRGKLPLIIWSAAMAAMLFFTVILYPLIEPMMDSMTELYESMGMDIGELKIDFTTYVCSEVVEMMALAGGVFTGILAVSALSGDERGGTAEFVLTHPVTRVRVALEKLLFILANLFIFSATALAATLLSAALIGEKIEFLKLFLIFFSFFVIQLVIASVCFLFSACVRANGIGFALGFALLSYVLQILAALSEKLSFLFYFTPNSMCSTEKILDASRLDWRYCIAWPLVALASLALALRVYSKKDILT